MTAPYTGYEAQWGAGSPLAQREWDDFNKRHKELVEAILGTVMDPGIQTMMGQQPVQQPAPVMQFDSPFGPPRPMAQDELIAQARFWGIANPEQMEPQELQLRIQQMRAEIPREEQTGFGSAAMAAFGFAAEAGTAASRVAGNIFGDLEQVPFVGPTLANILGTEKAKNWMYDLSQRTSEFVEAARASQPLQDKGAFEVLAASGKVAGYALPAMALWNTLGASGAWVPPAWGGRVSSPFMRAALRGGLTGGIMEVGSDEPTQAKIFNIGLGFALGGTTALPYIGASLGLGIVGAGIGGQVGDTPEERRRHAIQGGIAGAALGLSPLFLAAAAKIRQDIPGPFDTQVSTAVKSRPMGEDPARMRQQATARMQQQALPEGPDYEFHPTQGQPTTPQEILQIRSEAPLEAPQVFETPSVSPPPTQRMLPRFEESAPQPTNWLDPIKLNVPEPQIPRHLLGTRVVDERGYPVTVYHGTIVDFEYFDLSKADPEGLFGPGFYHTENPMVASGYAGIDETTFDPINSPPSQTGMAPAVRPARLNIQNPFNADKNYPEYEVSELVNRLEFAAPDYMWSEALPDGWGVQHDMTGVELYNRLARTPELTIAFGAEGIGKAGLNAALEKLGYDGITHEGGRITGGVSHRVWIAFRPDQVHSPWDTEPLNLVDARAQGDALSKQATIMESATLPQAMGKTQITDGDVIVAAEYSNPAGVSVIRGLRPHNLAEMFGNELLSGNVTFLEVPQGGGKDPLVDALAGDGVANMRQVIDEFSEHGFFTGQRVVVAGSGIEAVVINPAAKKGIMLRRADGKGPPITVGTYKIMPSRFGAPMFEAPKLYDSFKLDLLNYMNEESMKAQMAPVAGVWDPRVADVISSRSSDFMDRMGIYDPALRQVVEQDFNYRWVDELQDLDPEMKALQESAIHDAYTAHGLTEMDDLHNLPVSMEEKALSRGFIWITQPGDGGVLKDTVNPGTPDIPMATDEAANEFLVRTDRALPDYTPASDVPADLAMMLPHDINVEPQLPTEHLGDSISDSIDELTGDVFYNFHRVDVDYLNTSEGQNELARKLLSTDASVRAFRQRVGLSTEGPGFGGAGTPPPPPPALPPSGGMGELPPGPQETLGGQFDKLRRADPMKLHQMIYDFQGLLSNKIRYMRYGMLSLENRLTESGIDLGRAHMHYEELDTARSLAFNEAVPWIHEWGQIMHGFPKRILRDGTVSRLHGIEDPNARYAAYYRLGQSHGLNDRQVTNAIAADGRITDFMQRFFTSWTGDPGSGASAHSELFRYMSGVRSRQASQSPEPYDVDNLSSGIKFFGDMAKNSNMQFSIVDARELGLRMIRGAMFDKYEKVPYDQLIEAWSDPRVPEGMKNYMLDWARLVRMGYDPSGEVATRGIQSIMKRVFRTPLTAREAQHLLNMPTGAMYMSMLGGRMSIFFRDAIQPFLALAKVRVPFMASTYGRILKGSGQALTKAEANDFREMYQRGLAGGWIERENPNIEAASIYEEPGGIRTNELYAITPEEAARRETLAKLGDPLWGLPNWLVRPRESNVSTLKWYGRQGQLHRLIVGESAYQQSLAELSAYRRSMMEALINRDPTREMSYDSLADRAFFSSFEPPIQRRLRELVDAGDDEGAAQFFARQVSDWSQFRYGRREVPPILRNNVGRALFMFGNFTGQFLEGFASALANGTPMHKARYLMTIGTVSAAMYELKQLTGWSFNKWAWAPYAFQYTGGPLLERGMSAVSAVTGASNMAYGLPVSETERAAVQEQVSGTPFLPAVSDFFPYTGYIRSMAEYVAAGQGTNPIEQMARYSITGDRGSRIDIARQIEELGRQQGQIPEGTLSPNGGQMPGHGGQDYQFPQGRFPRSNFPHGTNFPGAGAQ